MDTVSIATWTILIQSFSSALTAPTTQIFVALLRGWVLCTDRRTITGMIPFADPQGRHAHDAFPRFFPAARWRMDTLWKLLTLLLVQAFAPRGVIEPDLDDTPFHRWGRKVCGAGWWRNPLPSTGKERDDFFFTTDLSLTAEQVIEGFAGRWSIEDTFKGTKQVVGGPEPQTYKGPGPERAAMLSLWLGSVVWRWFLQQPRRAQKIVGPAWYPDKTHPSFQDARAALRRHLWSQRMNTMFGPSPGHTQHLAVLIDALSRAA